MRHFHQLDAITVRVTEKHCTTPGAAARVGNPCMLKALQHRLHVTDKYCRMTITPHMLRSAAYRVRIGNLQKVNLLFTDIKPGPRVTDIGPPGISFELKYFTVKYQRTLYIRHHETDMMYTQQATHEVSPICSFAANQAAASISTPPTHS